MKLNKFLAVVLLATLISFTAKADLTFTSCVNGTFEEMNDGHFQIDILEDGVAFYPYEGHFSIDGADMTYSTSGVISVVDKKTEVSSEGETWTSTKNILLVLSSDKSKLEAAISTDGGPFMTYSMQCTEIEVF